MNYYLTSYKDKDGFWYAGGIIFATDRNIANDIIKFITVMENTCYDLQTLLTDRVHKVCKSQHVFFRFCNTFLANQMNRLQLHYFCLILHSHD